MLALMKAIVAAIAFICAISAGQSAAQYAPPSYADAAPAAGPSYSQADLDILYFAYNLEIFEANFYRCAADGTSVSYNFYGGGPAAVGCPGKANLNATTMAFASELAADENAHTVLLFNTLVAAGVNPVAPQTNISAGVFNTLIAGATGLNNPGFNPYNSDLEFLLAASTFEDGGASAYLGALPSITNPTYKQTASQIGAAEAYHASLLRTLLYLQLNSSPGDGLTVANVTSDIASLENTVAGPPTLKYNIYNGTGSQVVNANSQGLVPVATPQQILALVTGGAKPGLGGSFFPQNLNGNIKN